MPQKQQNASALSEDAAVLRHRPHALPWEFDTQDTGVTGFIPRFESTAVLPHLLPLCVIYLPSPCQEWENGKGQSVPGMHPGSEDSAPGSIGMQEKDALETQSSAPGKCK